MTNSWLQWIRQTSCWLKSSRPYGKTSPTMLELIPPQEVSQSHSSPPTHSECKTLRVSLPLNKSYSLPLLLQAFPSSIYIYRDSGDALPPSLSLIPINCLSNVFLTNFLKTGPFKTKLNFSTHRSKYRSHITVPLSWFSLVTAHPSLHI